MNKIQDDILSYREMCDAENVQVLQRGMNFHMNPAYSVILMSQCSNAPYKDKIHNDGITIEYEGHDEARIGRDMNPKEIDQPIKNKNGSLTQNGLFASVIEKGRSKKSSYESVKVYEKIMPGIWSLKGFFDLVDYEIVDDGKRNVYRFILRLSDNLKNIKENIVIDLAHTRLIPSEVKKEVWKRDGGKCVLCNSKKNLHFDHDLPFSKGGTSLTAKNIRLLCAKHNLSKSDKIE